MEMMITICLRVLLFCLFMYVISTLDYPPGASLCDTVVEDGAVVKTVGTNNRAPDRPETPTSYVDEIGVLNTEGIIMASSGGKAATKSLLSGPGSFGGEQGAGMDRSSLTTHCPDARLLRCDTTSNVLHAPNYASVSNGGGSKEHCRTYTFLTTAGTEARKGTKRLVFRRLDVYRDHGIGFACVYEVLDETTFVSGHFWSLYPLSWQDRYDIDKMKSRSVTRNEIELNYEMFLG